MEYIDFVLYLTAFETIHVCVEAYFWNRELSDLSSNWARLTNLGSVFSSAKIDRKQTLTSLIVRLQIVGHLKHTAG